MKDTENHNKLVIIADRIQLSHILIYLLNCQILHHISKDYEVRIWEVKNGDPEHKNCEPNHDEGEYDAPGVIGARRECFRGNGKYCDGNHV